MKDSFMYRAAVVAVVLVLGIGVWLFSKGIGAKMEKGSAQRAVQAHPQPAGDPPQLNIGESPYEGKKNAPVTMIECSDYQCPFCARFTNGALKQLRDNEIKEGKVKLVFKNFPLPFHQYAEKAAEAAECANTQGKFWQMHNLLFNSGGRLDVDSLKSYAKQIGLNSEKFDRCLETGETAGTVQADKSTCASAGVSGTPTFFINGRMLVGAQPYEQFKDAIVQAEK